jgi:CRP/FNR family transcriptional regulator, cyclic AMP receptor protein
MSGTTFDVEVIAAAGAPVLNFADGTILFHRDDPGDCAYIVKAGQIQIRENGHMIETIETGEIFGEMALIDDAPLTASATAAGNVQVIPIDRPMFEVLIRDDSDFALTILRLTVRRLRAAMNVLEGQAVEASAA